MHERPSKDFYDPASAMRRIERDRHAKALIRGHRCEAARDGGVWLAVALWSGALAKDWRESVVISSMVESGIEAFCPVDIKEIRKPRSKKMQAIPTIMFAGYGFVRIHNCYEAILGVLSFEGVIGLVGGSGKPRVIPDKIIEELRIYEALSPKQRRLISSVVTVGDTVTITRNVFKGFEAEVVNVDAKSGMIDVTATLFGGSSRMTIGLDEVEKLA